MRLGKAALQAISTTIRQTYEVDPREVLREFGVPVDSSTVIETVYIGNAGGSNPAIRFTVTTRTVSTHQLGQESTS
jgi:hypothetical protein